MKQNPDAQDISIVTVASYRLWKIRPKPTVLFPVQKEPRDVTQCQTLAALVLCVAHKWCWTDYSGTQLLVPANMWFCEREW